MSSDFELDFRIGFRTTRADATYVEFLLKSEKLFHNSSLAIGIVGNDTTRKTLTPVQSLKLRPFGKASLGWVTN